MRISSVLKTALAGLLLPVVIVSTLFADDGSLTPKQIGKLRASLKMDGRTRAMYNAITNCPINELALNRDLLRQHNDKFSHKIKTKGITNQKSSGRCWLFAGLNVMRPAVIEKYNLETFEFSQNYLAFWDKMEKANCFLEAMIELAGRDPLDRELTLVLEDSFYEGGWWNYVVALIDKYGAVPKDVMPETQSSENSRSMHKLIGHKLRINAAKLRAMHRAGEPVKALRAEKKKMLREIYRMLVLNLGEPPTEFEWRYADKDSKLSELRSYTPESFYKEFAGVDLGEYVSLFHDPTQPYGKHYRLSRTRNMVGGPEMHYANVDIGVLESVAVKSVLDDAPVWFAADVGKGQDSEHGIMAANIFDYATVYNVGMSLSKADQVMLRGGASNHAMVFVGVNVADGKPDKWLVENSWGDKKGEDGYWTLYDSYFDRHVYNVIVKRTYVPAEVLKIYEQDPVTLPPWYPTARMFR